MNKAVRTVGFIAAATLISKLMGMWRDIILAQSFGTGIELDAYMAASRIPLLFFDFTLGAAIISTFIPVFNRYLQRGDDNRAKEFSNSFIKLVVLISAVFCFIGIIFSSQLTSLIAPGYASDVKLLTSHLLIIMLPTIIFTTLAFSFVGILQSYGEFNIPAIISLVSNAAVIVYLLFFNKSFGIYGLAVAMLVGWAMQAAVQIPALVKRKYEYSVMLNLKDEGIKDVFVLAASVLISSWLQPICVLVNTIFASYLQSGSVAALELANRLYIIVVGVFVFAITNYAFPALSKMSGGGDDVGFADVMRKSLCSMLVIIAPIMSGMMIISREIITVFYARGVFDERAVTLTSIALFFYSIGMLAYGTNEILNKCFYAMEDGKTPMIASFFGIGGVVFFAFLFTRVLKLEIGGLALSASVSAILVSIVLIYKMNKRVLFIDKNLIIFVAKTAVSIAAMIAAVLFVKGLVADYGIWIRLFAPVLAGAVAYLPLMLLFGLARTIKEGII